MEKYNKHPDCLMGGCAEPRNCENCGFDRKEAARRRRLPFSIMPDGIRRKFVHKWDAAYGMENKEPELQPQPWTGSPLPDRLRKAAGEIQRGVESVGYAALMLEASAALAERAQRT